MAQQCFNHPMVKVKAVASADIATILRFNHPMVKVKGAESSAIAAEKQGFQPPYGES